MKRFIILSCLIIFMAGCGFKGIWGGPEYIWNETSGKAGEGRCHMIINGQPGPFAEDSKCGR